MQTSYPPIVLDEPDLLVPRPRRLSNVPSLPPPVPDSPPPIPSRPRPIEFVPGYTVTTHIIPAAHPRYIHTLPAASAHIRDQVKNDLPNKSASKATKLAWARSRTEELLRKREEIVQILDSDPVHEVDPETSGPLLWSVVNRYARVEDRASQRGRGVTIIAFHANGFHKELWEPCIKELIEVSRRPGSTVVIDEVWAFDAVIAGDAAVLNAGNLSDYADWFDNVRDVSNFVSNHLPAGPFVPLPTPLPTHLEPVSRDVAISRARLGVPERLLVALGHSSGGCALANLACQRPNLFRSLILVEPMILTRTRDEVVPFVFNSLMRRGTWSSRDEAMTLLSKQPFFASWVPEALALYVEHGTREDSDGRIVLKTDPFLEAASFAEDRMQSETAQLLRSLDPRVKIHWIMAGGLLVGSTERMRRLVWPRLQNSTNVIIQKSGHLMVQEAPRELATEIMRDLGDLLGGMRGVKPSL